MPFFQPPLRLDDLQRASTSAGAAPAPPPPSRDSPSPNKKRRVESVPPTLAARRLPASAESARGTSASPAPRSQAAVRKSASDAARRNEINARYAELTRDEARLQATLKLQDAWEDIQRRHSLLAGGSGSGTPDARPKSSRKRYRHRPGRTRALPVEEDDIIDLSSLDFVQDRGVLRSSKAGGFAIGRYGHARDGDIVVGYDTGGGENAGGNAGDADQAGPSEEEDDEDEEEWQDYTDSDAPTYSSDDELGDEDDLLPPPSLQFREQRRREAERLREMREFQEQEAKARGEAAEARQADIIVVGERGGNVQLPAPVGPPSSAPSRPRRRAPPRWESDDDDDDLALTPCRARSTAPPASTQSLNRWSKAMSQPPSSTASLRRSFSDVRLDKPAPRLPSTSASDSLRAAASPRRFATSSPAPVAPASPPPSFSSTRKTPVRRSSLSRPPVSSSPLREITVAESRPAPPPPPPLPRPSRTRAPQSRPRSPSPELFGPREELATLAPASNIKPPKPASRRTPFQQATPTPTPPPPPKATSAARDSSVAPSRPRKPRHSFELVIDIKPPRSSMTPAPPSTRPTSSSRVASSASMPSISTAAVTPTAKKLRESGTDERAEERPLVGGLSTPPLSKRSSVPTRRSSSGSPPKPQVDAARPASQPRVKATPSVILPAPPERPSSTTKAAPTLRRDQARDSDDDELMLSSPSKPSSAPRYLSRRPSATPGPPARIPILPARGRARSVSVGAVRTPLLGDSARRSVVPEASESEDELGKW